MFQSIFIQLLISLINTCFFSRHVRHLACDEQVHSGGQTGAVLRVALRPGRLAGGTDLHRPGAGREGARNAERGEPQDQAAEDQALGLPGGNATQHRRTASVQEGRVPHGHRSADTHPAGGVQLLRDIPQRQEEDPERRQDSDNHIAPG